MSSAKKQANKVSQVKKIKHVAKGPDGFSGLGGDQTDLVGQIQSSGMILLRLCCLCCVKLNYASAHSESLLIKQADEWIKHLVVRNWAYVSATGDLLTVHEKIFLVQTLVCLPLCHYLVHLR